MEYDRGEFVKPIRYCIATLVSTRVLTAITCAMFGVAYFEEHGITTPPHQLQNGFFSTFLCV